MDLLTLGSWAQTCRGNHTMLSQKLAPVKGWWNEVIELNQVREEDWKRIFYLKVKVLNWNGGEVHAEEAEAFRLACTDFKEALAKHSGFEREDGSLVPPCSCWTVGWTHVKWMSAGRPHYTMLLGMVGHQSWRSCWEENIMIVSSMLRLVTVRQLCTGQQATTTPPSSLYY